MSVILINPFEVPSSNVDQFVSSWGEAAEYMKRQPGFIGTRLHRALRPDARFGFINVVEWESPQHFMRAIQTPEFQKLSEGSPPNFPTLYEVLRTEGYEGAPAQADAMAVQGSTTGV